LLGGPHIVLAVGDTGHTLERKV